MTFAQLSPGVWIFGSYRVERFQHKGVVAHRFRAKYGDIELGVRDFKVDCEKLCAKHRRAETIQALEKSWRAQ
jgi:hypothetical protein